jgi:hypothetical protein
LQHLSRQTDGSIGIVSNGAIDDLDLERHGYSSKMKF